MNLISLFDHCLYFNHFTIQYHNELLRIQIKKQPQKMYRIVIQQLKHIPFPPTHDTHKYLCSTI